MGSQKTVLIMNSKIFVLATLIFFIFFFIISVSARPCPDSSCATGDCTTTNCCSKTCAYQYTCYKFDHKFNNTENGYACTSTSNCKTGDYCSSVHHECRGRVDLGITGCISSMDISQCPAGSQYYETYASCLQCCPTQMEGTVDLYYNPCPSSCDAKQENAEWWCYDTRSCLNVTGTGTNCSVRSNCNSADCTSSPNHYTYSCIKDAMNNGHCYELIYNGHTDCIPDSSTCNDNCISKGHAGCNTGNIYKYCWDCCHTPDCYSAADCDDGNGCTYDWCQNGGAVNARCRHELCNLPTNCGGGGCLPTEKPSWYCSSNTCKANCVNAPTCTTPTTSSTTTTLPPAPSTTTTTTLPVKGIAITVVHPYVKYGIVPIITGGGCANPEGCPNFTRSMPIEFLVTAVVEGGEQCNNNNCNAYYYIDSGSWNPMSWDEFSKAWREAPSSSSLNCDQYHNLSIKVNNTDGTASNETIKSFFINCKEKITVNPMEKRLALGESNIALFNVTVWNPKDSLYNYNITMGVQEGTIEGVLELVNFESDGNNIMLTVPAVSSNSSMVYLINAGRTGIYQIIFSAKNEETKNIIKSTGTLAISSESLYEFSLLYLVILMLISAVIYSTNKKTLCSHFS